MLDKKYMTKAPVSKAGGASAIILAAVLLVGCEVTYFPSESDVPAGIGEVELTKIDTVGSEAMAVFGGNKGAIWAITKYDVIKFPAGDLEKQKNLLDPQIFQKRFRDSMGSLSSGTQAANGWLWVGTWDGEVYSLHKGKWRRFIPESHGLGGPISGIVLNDTSNVMWVGARDALWKVVKKPSSLDFVLEKKIEAVAIGADGTVAAGSYDGVDVYRNGEARSLWSIQDGDKGVTGLGAFGDGWWVGTHNGFVLLDASGAESGRELDGRWITAVVDHPAGRVVGSWQSGLWLEDAGQWLNLSSAQGLPDDSISSLHVDAQGRLWIALYGAGVYVGDLEALRKEAKAIAAGEGAAG